MPRTTLQLAVVTTAHMDTTEGVLRRYERASARAAWRPVGMPVPVVVGRTGLAWPASARMQGASTKREGDGRAPAGRFPLDTAFGFAPRTASRWIRMPYVALTAQSECVDDVRSAHYNTVVERDAVPRIDWASSERMREIDQYRLGVIVGYNVRPPVRGAGSCIFLHVWAGPGTSTAGCTAMAERDLRELMLWLDPARSPELVQLPEAEYARSKARGELP